MSEIAKCPICQSTMTLYEEHMDGSDAIACNKCSFTCAEKDLPRIAAAMEYAKKTVYWFGLPGGVDHQEDARAEQAMRDAETRVLEVFVK